VKVKARTVSKLKDNLTWCTPSDGYNHENAVTIELDDYEVIDTIQGELPKSDKICPKGAPFTGCFLVGNKIYRKAAS
jgi:hypothetical protein